MKIIILVIISVSYLLAHDAEKEGIEWKQYYRFGVVHSIELNNGIAGYYRLKRITKNTFKDIRFFGHYFKQNSEIKIRQKSSRRFLTFKKIYSFNTLIYEKNTAIDIDLRYQYSQGLGLFINKNKSGNQTLEIGISFDHEDYLNTKQRKTYTKFGCSVDQNINNISSKFEIDYFYNINTIKSGSTLSRFQVLGELQWIFTDNIGAIVGLTWDIQKNNPGPSIFSTISITNPLDWIF